MPLSLRSRFWRFFLRITIKERHLTFTDHRARAARNSGYADRVPKGVKVERIDIDDIRAAWIRPSMEESKKIILHFHGGGYATGSINSHLMMCAPMAQTLKMNILLPEYRLAPEHPFPAALEDAQKVYCWLIAQGHKSSDIVISGDSAGGGLGVATVLTLRDANEPLPAAVVCLSPWVDLTNKGGSHITNANSEAVFKTKALKEWALFYTEESNLSNPLVSPVFADFHGFPPLLILAGSEEILLDDSLALAEKARADGVAVTLRIWDRMWHDWTALGDLIPESRQAFEEVRAFVKEYIE